MNEIRLVVRTIEASGEDESESQDVVEVFVDGNNFIDLIRAVEYSYACAEGHPDIAGGYSGLSARKVLPPSRHFWGTPEDKFYKQNGKVSIYDCTCGCAGCWPLVVKITVDVDIVKWSDFEQPHRGHNSATLKWDYTALGTLIFDRKVYEQALWDAAQWSRGDSALIVNSVVCGPTRPL